ncbi:hypothetical protein B1690_16255 [Geobacillus sp. 46C-IIa]|nr:hypothetical protein B1690_16255 [Geobacillus sp. 46C-IIa]
MVARKNDIYSHLSVHLMVKRKEPARGHGSSFMIHPRFAQSSSTLITWFCFYFQKFITFSMACNTRAGVGK